MRIGIHTDNYRLENRSLDYCLDSIRGIGATITELNVFEGFDFFSGQGFSPNVSMSEDPLEIREKLEKRGMIASCLDAHYPLWSHRCIEHLRSAIIFADGIGVDAVATTDSEYLPAGMSEEEAFTIIKYHLGQVLPVAERHKIPICLEPHGQLTNHPEKLTRLVNCHKSDYLRINFDTANTFIRGWEPPAFLDKVIDKVHHCHVKDVPQALADAVRGKETGIASSEVSLGEGVNAANIIACLKIFAEHDYKGVLSIECHGEERSKPSFAWLTEQVRAAQSLVVVNGPL